MSRILVIGTGPLYSPSVRQFNGQGLRTWQFASCLRGADHDVTLVVFPPEGPPIPTADDPRLLMEVRQDDFRYYAVNSHDRTRTVPALEQLIERVNAQAIVAVNHNAAWICCQLETDLPLWADLNGYMMGEAQAKACVYENDEYLLHFWQRQRMILRRADVFSAVSKRQMYATIGELGGLGRLNRHNARHRFVRTIPNAMAPQFVSPPPRREHFRGVVFPRDCFAVLWSGGFNTWTDPMMLADALSLAMMSDPAVHFVASGGAIAGHDEHTYDVFVNEMTQRGLAERCTLLGWIENERIFDLYRDCDLGLCVDGVNYETLMGARNRVTNMVAMGLPVLSTFGTEVVEDLQSVNGILTVAPGDAQAMASAIADAATRRDELREMAQRAAQYAQANWTIESATEPVLEWAAHPAPAPDNAVRSELLRRRRDESPMHYYKPNPVHASISSLDEEARISATENLVQLIEARRDLQLVRGKWPVRAWHQLKSLFRGKKA